MHVAELTSIGIIGGGENLAPSSAVEDIPQQKRVRAHSAPASASEVVKRLRLSTEAFVNTSLGVITSGSPPSVLQEASLHPVATPHSCKLPELHTAQLGAVTKALPPADILQAEDSSETEPETPESRRIDKNRLTSARGGSTKSVHEASSKSPLLPADPLQRRKPLVRRFPKRLPAEQEHVSDSEAELELRIPSQDQPTDGLDPRKWSEGEIETFRALVRDLPGTP